MNTTKYIGGVAVAGLLMSIALVATPALAQDNGQNGRGHDMFARIGVFMRRGIVGTVTAVNGTTLTVQQTKPVGMPPHTQSASPSPTPTPVVTFYTVDAANAKVSKNGADATLSSIIVGDMVMVNGKVTGTNVAATFIRAGIVPKLTGSPKPKPTPLITGNGQPVIGGKVTAISGGTISITNASNVSYTINASSAVIVKDKVAGSLASIVVGDTIVAQGSINGNAMVATSVQDSGAIVVNQPHGFFGGLKNFFGHLFGF